MENEIAENPALGALQNLNDMGMLNFSVSGLISGFIFGMIGLYLFREARKRQNFKAVLIGIALMLYPYITRGPWQDWGVGILLCGLAYYVWE